MANIGLSQPYYAKYAFANGAITYTGLAKLGKATTVDLSLDNKDPEKLIADNGVAESLWLFSGATVTLGIDELELATAADIMGLTAPGSSSSVISFDPNAVAPYVGLGFIVKKVHGGTISWRVVTLAKCQFKPVDFSVNTQGETVEFQTPELEAAVLTPDTGSWQTWGDYTTEAAALTALRTALGGSGTGT